MSARLTASFSVTVVVDLDEPLRVETMTGDIAATQVRVTVHNDGTGDEDAVRVHGYVSGYGYRANGSVGSARRKSIVDLDALPAALVDDIGAAHGAAVRRAHGEPSPILDREAHA